MSDPSPKPIQVDPDKAQNVSELYIGVDPDLNGGVYLFGVLNGKPEGLAAFPIPTFDLETVSKKGKRHRKKEIDLTLFAMSLKSAIERAEEIAKEADTKFNNRFIAIERPLTLPVDGKYSIARKFQAFGTLCGFFQAVQASIQASEMWSVYPIQWKSVVFKGANKKGKEAALRFYSTSALFERTNETVAQENGKWHGGMVDAACIAYYVYIHRMTSDFGA